MKDWITETMAKTWLGSVYALESSSYCDLWNFRYVTRFECGRKTTPAPTTEETTPPCVGVWC